MSSATATDAPFNPSGTSFASFGSWQSAPAVGYYGYASSSSTDAKAQSATNATGDKFYKQRLAAVIGAKQNSSIGWSPWAYPLTEATLVQNGAEVFNSILRENDQKWPREYKFTLYDYINADKPYDPKDATAFNMKVTWRNTYVRPSFQLAARTHKDGSVTFGLAGTKKLIEDKRENANEYEDNPWHEPMYLTYNKMDAPGEGASKAAVSQALALTLKQLADQQGWGIGTYFATYVLHANPETEVYTRMASQVNKDIKSLAQSSRVTWPEIDIQSYSKSGAYSGTNKIIFDRNKRKFFVANSEYEDEVKALHSDYDPANVQDITGNLRELAGLAEGATVTGEGAGSVPAFYGSGVEGGGDVSTGNATGGVDYATDPRVAAAMQFTQTQVGQYRNLTVTQQNGTTSNYFDLLATMASQINLAISNSNVSANAIASLTQQLQAFGNISGGSTPQINSNASIKGIQIVGIWIDSIQKGILISTANGNAPYYINSQGGAKVSVLNGIDAGMVKIRSLLHVKARLYGEIKIPANKDCIKYWPDLIGAEVDIFYFMQDGLLCTGLYCKRYNSYIENPEI